MIIMNHLILPISSVVFLFLSCSNHQESLSDRSFEDTVQDSVWYSSESEETKCDCWENPYIDDVENDPDFFRKIECGDTDAFEIFYRYATYTNKREDIFKVIQYALLLEKKYQYSHGYHIAADGYVLLYENYHHLTDSDKKKLVLYYWKSYYKHDRLKSMYHLRIIYNGDLDPSMKDEEQYKICDSIFNSCLERNRKRREENK